MNPLTSKTSKYTSNVTCNVLSGAVRPDSRQTYVDHTSTYEEGSLQGDSHINPLASQNVCPPGRAIGTPSTAADADGPYQPRHVATRGFGSCHVATESDDALAKRITTLLLKTPHRTVPEIAREMRRRQEDVRRVLRHPGFGTTSAVPGRRSNGHYYFIRKNA
jgi:hypothetical protein